MATKPLWWDVTIPQDKISYETLKAILETIAERFVIGKETGKAGYKHYQVRIVCPNGKGRTLEELVKILPFHWTPTATKNFAYCEKEGDFYRSWEGALTKYQDIKLREWQKEAIELLETQNEREIVVILDPKGGAGKTTLAKYLQATHRAQYCPQMETAQDYMAFAMAKPSRAYILDMPKAENMKKRKSLWSAIEQIKNGYLYDKRYAYKDTWIEAPKILVICNEKPPIECLSKDRWIILKVTTWEGVDTFLEDITTECVTEDLNIL